MPYRIMRDLTPRDPKGIGLEGVAGWALTRWGACRKLIRYRRLAAELQRPDRSYDVTFEIR